jgi:hypothetical protein
MGVQSAIISIVLTIVVLIMSIITISKGYGYKHKVDPKIDPIPEDGGQESERKTS